jgi:hypothetical protein
LTGALARELDQPMTRALLWCRHLFSLLEYIVS